MNDILEDFENIKISALSKVKLVSKDIKDVTIGPNCKQNDKINSENFQKPKASENLYREVIVREQKEKPKIKEKIAVEKILVEAETQRRHEVEANVMNRIANLNAATQQFDSNIKIQWLRRQQLLIEQNQQQEDIMLRILQEHDRKACDLSEQLQLQFQKQQDERQRRLNLELQNKERERQLLFLIESIHKQQIAFRTVYQEIVGILKGCTNNKCVNKIISNHSSIKTLPETMDKIKEKCKLQRVTEAELQLAKSLVLEIGKLKEIISIEVVQLNEKERLEAELVKHETEIAKQREKLRLDQEKLAAKQAQPKEIPSQNKFNIVSSSVPVNPQNTTTENLSDYNFVSRDNFLMFSELRQNLDNYESTFQHVINDPKLKTFKFACQKAVNIPLNSISAVTSQHLNDKYIKLVNLLTGKNVEAGGTMVCASQHPEGIAYCTNLLAKKFVLQGDLIVSSKPETAFCLAAVLTALWIDLPEFGKLVLAHFQKEVPYLVPMYPVMVQAQSDQDYFKSLGYRYIDGVVEKQDKFLKRMSGIMRLYSAVLISRLKRSHQDREHPHGLIYAWKWFASMLNLEPCVDITATLLFEFLEVAGSTMQAAYGNQFKKLIIYCTEVYFPRMQKIDSGGPMTRLEVLLQKINSTGHIEPPRGRLPENFW